MSLFWKDKPSIKIASHDITEAALFSLGYKWELVKGDSGTIAIDESGEAHFSFSGDLVGYTLNPNSMTFYAVNNKYIWENL